MRSFAEQIESIELPTPQVSTREKEDFDTYLNLLVQWNPRANLVSKKSLSQAVGQHFLDSLWISDFAFSFVQKSVNDLGTGGGFPGLVFAIRYPNVSVKLYERKADKRAFLAVVVGALKLSNVEILDSPADRLQGVWLARAVYQPPELLNYFKSRLAIGGYLIHCATNGPSGQFDGFESESHSQYELPGGVVRFVAALKRL